jgi:hypothetical protein
MYENIFTRANICCYGDNPALRRKNAIVQITTIIAE